MKNKTLEHMKKSKKILTALLFWLVPILCYSQAKPYQTVLTDQDTLALIPIEDYRPLIFAVYKERECQTLLIQKQVLLEYNLLGWQLAESEIEEYKNSLAAKEYALVQNDTIQSNNDLIIKGLKKKIKHRTVELVVISTALVAVVMFR